MSSPKTATALRVGTRTAVIALLGLCATAPAWAQTAPLSYQAAPEIYKVITESEQSRLIVVTWQPGQRDVLHGHRASSYYYLTDCTLRITMPEGGSRTLQMPAGMAGSQGAVAAHTVENVGTAVCRMLMFEAK